MKTTLEVPDALYRQIKAQAALENSRVQDLVAEGLRLALAQRSAKKETALRTATFPLVRSRKGTRRLGVQEMERAMMAALADEDAAQHALTL